MRKKRLIQKVLSFITAASLMLTAVPVVPSWSADTEPPSEDIIEEEPDTDDWWDGNGNNVGVYVESDSEAALFSSLEDALSHYISQANFWDKFTQSKYTGVLEVGESITVTGNITMPKCVYLVSSEWRIENDNITYSVNGDSCTVTGAKEGPTSWSYVIRVYLEDLKGQRSSVQEYTIYEYGVGVKDTSGQYVIRPCDTEMEIGESQPIEIAIQTAQGINDLYYFVHNPMLYSDNPSVLRIDYETANSKFGEYSFTAVALKEGTANIYAGSENGNGAKPSEKVQITVKGKDVLPQSIAITSGIVLNVDECINMAVTFTPNNVTDKTLTWKSSDTSVANVDSNGNVTGLRAGTAKITATTVNGKSASTNITVYGYPDSITIDGEDNIKLMAKKDINLTYTVTPSKNIAKFTVEWFSSDESVAVVKNSIVTARKEGTATITAKIKENGIRDTVKVTVEPEKIEAQSVSLNKTSLRLKKGESETLTATLLPHNVTEKELKWTTDKTSVATVDKDGKVTAVKEGTAVITVTTSNGKTKSCTVTVEKGNIEAESVSLNKTSLKLKKGDTATLAATILPADITDKKITWSTSDSSIASVSNGKVTALKKGTATITVKTTNGKSASCTVTVEESVIEASSVTLDRSTIMLEKGDTAELTATVTPANTADKSLTWSSSDTTVVSVSNGKITALKKGTATITVTTVNGKSANCTVTVTESVIEATSVVLNKTSLTLKKGETETLTATVNPSDAADKSITWSSSDTNVVSVSDGKVTALKGGTATVTAKTFNGKTASCTVTVTEELLPESIICSIKNVTIEVGEVFAVRCKVSPPNLPAAASKLTFKSDNEDIAQSWGIYIVGVNPGNTTITATTVNGLTFTINVTVIEKNPSVSLPSQIVVYEGDTINLSQYAAIVPDKFSVDMLKWTVGNNNIGTISGDTFTALSAGETYVRATYERSTSSCTIIVKPESEKLGQMVTGMSVSPDKITETIGHTQKLSISVTPENIDPSKLDIIWTSSDLSTVYVSSDGQITLKKEGTAYVTASLASGKSATCTITSKAVPQNDYSDVQAYLTEQNQKIYMEVGETRSFDYYLSDESIDKSKVEVEWSLAPYSTGLKLNPDGSVTAEDAGNAVVRLIAKNATTPQMSSVNIIIKYNDFQLDEKRLEFAQEILRLCNEERAKEGLNPLELSTELCFAAQIRSDEQTATGMDISHTRPNGTKWTTVFESIHFPMRSWGENLAQGTVTPECTVKLWMESEGHRKNIMRPEFTHLGVGTTFSDVQCKNAYICTQLFAQSSEKPSAENKVKVNSQNVTLYSSDALVKKYLTLPDGYNNEFQLEVTGAENVKYEVIPSNGKNIYLSQIQD